MNLIKRTRVDKGLTLIDVKNGTGIAISTLIDYEKNERIRPQPRTLKKLCAFLDIEYKEALKSMIENE